VGERESDLASCKLGAIGPVELSGSKGSSSDNLDGTGTAAMTSSHFIVQLRNSTSEFQITVLAVHIVGTGTGGVTEPDPVVLNDARVLFDDLDTVEDFTGGFLHLAELVHVVPEFGLGDGGVGCEDDHAVCLGIVVFGGSGFAADYLVLVHLSCNSHFFFNLMSFFSDTFHFLWII
jgi:hypothetical protein